MLYADPIEDGQYIRIGRYTLDEVLPFVIAPERLLRLKRSGVKKGSAEYIQTTERDFDGHMVKMYSQRYQLFAVKGVKGVECVGCGLKGEYFGLEKNKGQEGNRYHFNLYGIRDGAEVLITKDHIVPKSKGGQNILDNYQVMCFNCNIEKGDSL